MATRFFELNDAAKMLGLTPDQLVELRSNGTIHGYRDGASWKFKAEEIERVAKELQGTGTERGEDRIPFDSDMALAAPPANGEEDEGSISGQRGGAGALRGDNVKHDYW